MVRMCVVEDDDSTAKILMEYLHRYAEENGKEISTVRFSDAESFIESYTADCDVVFMDIDLPGMNGMKTVEKLREKDKDIAVIFVTNFAQYAVSSYNVRAFDFIVKPVSYYIFALKMNGLFEYLKNFRKVMVMVSSNQGKKVINVSELKYIEVNKHTITYHTESESITCSGTLKNIYEKLKDLPFALCNQCYLVNLRFVEGVSGNTLYLKDEELQISAPKRKEFLNRLTQYVSSSRGGE